MVRRLPWTVVACIVAWPSVAMAAEGGDSSRDAATAHLDNLVADGFVLSSDDDSASAHFQFEYECRASNGPGEYASIGCVVERAGSRSSALLLAEGLPYAHVSQDRLTFPDRADTAAMQAFAGYAFVFRGRNVSEILKAAFGLRDASERPEIRLDIGSLVKDIRAIDPKPSFDHRTQTFTFKRPNGSIALIRLPRERRKEQAPIASIVLENSRGEGIAIRGFDLRTDPERAIGRLAPPAGAVAPVTEEDLVARHGSMEAAILWMMQPPVVSELVADPQWQSAGVALLDWTPVEGRFTPAEREKFDGLLTALKRTTEQPGADDESSEEDYLSLQRLLLEKVVWPSMVVDVTAKTVGQYVTGYDRHRSARLLETHAGPVLARRFYEVFGELTLNRRATADVRAVAMAMLAEVGIPEGDGLIRRIEAGLESEPPSMVRFGLAELRAQTGTPTDEDVELLRGIARDDVGKMERLTAMESLLLIDEAEGLTSEFEETIAQDGSLTLRCLMAAGCSEEGRDVLLKLARQRPEWPSLPDIVRCMHGGIRPDDRQGPDCLAMMKRFALDENLGTDVRWLAADYAAADAKDTTFREQFIHSALRSQNPLLISRLLQDYLGAEQSTYSYLHDFEGLLDSPNGDLRLAAAMTFCGTCSPRPPEEYREGVLRVVRKILTHDDPDIRQVTWIPLLLKMTQDNRELLAELYPDLVEAARDAKSPPEFMTFATWVSVLSDGTFRLTLPFIHLDDDQRIRTDPAGTQLIENHRPELQRRLDEWLENLPKKGQARST